MITKKDIQACLSAPVTLFDWHLQRLRKRDRNVWVFGAWRGDLYADSTRAFFEWMNENHPEITTVWLTRNQRVYDQLQSKGLKVAYINSPEGRQWCKKAALGFSSWGWKDLNERCLNGLHMMWLWHGVPIKQIGNDLAAFRRDKSFWKKVKTAVRKIVVPWEFLSFDFMITSSHFFTPFFMSAFGINRECVHLTGCPRNDNFWRKDSDQFIKSINEKFNNPTKILFMPTFRDDANDTGKPYNPFAGYGFDAHRFAKILEDKNIVFLYKGHYYDIETGSGDLKVRCDRFINITGDEYDDQYLFIKDCDILMTDYSSIYFDWLLMRKPIIMAPFDYDTYVKNSRQFYFDYNIMKGDYVNNWNEWCDLVEKGEYMPITEDLVDSFCGVKDNKSSERLFQEVSKYIERISF